MKQIMMSHKSMEGLTSILKGIFGMDNGDTVFAITSGFAAFGQRRREALGKTFGHLNMVTLRAYDTGTTTQYDVMVKPHDNHRWTLGLRTESLFKVAELIAAKVVK